MAKKNQLHLLRGFTQWRSGKHLKDAEAYVERVRAAGYDVFYTWTKRRPKRADELKGGSVYFCRSGFTLFRMPFKRLVPIDGGFRIEMKPEIIRVEAKRVGMVRGWRYLEGDVAPADTPYKPDTEPEDARIAAEKQFEQELAGV